MSGVWLENLTCSEAKARFDATAVVIVPIGGLSTIVLRMRANSAKTRRCLTLRVRVQS
jgi:hypothetical protein